ncbi:MAG: hypothetical protein LBC74_03345 [Planctomycetaceae bacterium]|nr:hypothetical protein [Planctomycetaceae bacterium]
MDCLDLFSNLKIHQRNKKNYNEKPPLTPPRPPLTPPKERNKKTPSREGNKETPPNEANNSPPSEGSGVVSYRLAKRSFRYCEQFRYISYNC